MCRVCPPIPRHYASFVVVEPAAPSGVCRRCLALHMSPRVVLPQLAVLMPLTWAGTPYEPLGVRRVLGVAHSRRFLGEPLGVPRVVAA